MSNPLIKSQLLYPIAVRRRFVTSMRQQPLLLDPRLRRLQGSLGSRKIPALVATNATRTGHRRGIDSRNKKLRLAARLGRTGMSDQHGNSHPFDRAQDRQIERKWVHPRDPPMRRHQPGCPPASVSPGPSCPPGLSNCLKGTYHDLAFSVHTGPWLVFCCS